jgi:hypothetical protein
MSSSSTGLPPNPLILPDQVVDRLWHIPFNSACAAAFLWA